MFFYVFLSYISNSTNTLTSLNIRALCFPDKFFTSMKQLEYLSLPWISKLLPKFETMFQSLPELINLKCLTIYCTPCPEILHTLFDRYKIKNRVFKCDKIYELNHFSNVKMVAYVAHNFRSFHQKLFSHSVEYIHFQFSFKNSDESGWDNLQQLLTYHLPNLKGIVLILKGPDFYTTTINENNVCQYIERYVHWQNRHFEKIDIDKLKNYWKTKFEILNQFGIKCMTCQEIRMIEREYCKNEWKLSLDHRIVPNNHTYFV